MPTENIYYKDIFSSSYKMMTLVLSIIGIAMVFFFVVILSEQPSVIGLPIAGLIFIIWAGSHIRSAFLKKVTLTKDGRLISRGDKLFYKFRDGTPENIYTFIRGGNRGGGWDFQFYIQLSNIQNVYITNEPKRYSSGSFAPELHMVKSLNPVCLEFKNELVIAHPGGNITNLFSENFPNLNKIYISVHDPEKLVEDIKHYANIEQPQEGN